jgi:hypothetical protein
VNLFAGFLVAAQAKFIGVLEGALMGKAFDEEVGGLT